MIGVAVKMFKSVNPFFGIDDNINLYKSSEEENRKFAVSLGNLKIKSNKLRFVDSVLLLFRGGKDGYKKGLLCKLNDFSVEKEEHIPDSMKDYLTKLSEPSKVWLLLSDAKEVEEDYFDKCVLLYDETTLSAKLKSFNGSSGRFPFTYFKEVE